MNIAFENTIGVGTVLAFIGQVIFYTLLGAGFYYAIKTELKILSMKYGIMDKRMEAMEETAKAIAKLLTARELQDQTIAHIQHEIDDLKRGRGFIRDPSNRVGIDGDYN